MLLLSRRHSLLTAIPCGPDVIEFGLDLGDALELQIELRAALLDDAREALELFARNGSAGRPLHRTQHCTAELLT